jgi:hypothetical protein
VRSERTSSSSLAYSRSSLVTTRCGARRAGALARRLLLTGVALTVEGAATGRSVVVFAGANCPSTVWTNAAF